MANLSTNLDYFVVDVFTETLLAGNPLAVVLSMSYFATVETGRAIHFEVSAVSSVAPSNAGGMTSNPNLKNCQPLICSPSRRSAINHNTVASEPVTERLGRDQRQSKPRRGCDRDVDCLYRGPRE